MSTSTNHDYDRSDVTRLLKAFQHQEPDRIPHLEFWVTSQSVFEYVLEKSLDYEIVDAALGGQSITPEDHVEFARRLGMDAVVCNFNWRPNNIMRMASDGTEHYVDGSIKSEADLGDLEPPTPIDAQLRYLERYLRAAQGTGVGVFANFTSFFDSAMLAVGVADSFLMFYDNRPFLERLMDILLDHQEKVMQAVCDEFASELAFILVNDDIGHNQGLMINPEMFREIFPERMKRLIAPAKAAGKLVAYHTDGKMDMIFPILDEIGFDICHPIEPESNDIFQAKAQWGQRFALVGNIPTVLLAYGTIDEIDEMVRTYCAGLGEGGGYVLGSSTSIMEGIPPQNFVAMTQAAHKYGRYGSLGRSN
ncbi:MAG: uroporphyrinogen decarboxylase family protein [Anaerolineae bacterium]